MLTSAGPRPARVNFALNLLWITIALGVFRLWRGWGELTSAAPTAIVAGTAVFVIGVLALLLVFIGMRKNWARIVYLLLFLIGVPSGAKGIVHALDTDALVGAISIIQIALQLIALVLLFHPESNAWFRNRETGS
jgi:hypothetical protein